ncbi:MAG: DUF302 domain-containing protein [Opitutaceae bacterium]|nr:DUF302 domain-containing protein [Opitutaceae bacterium]
MNSDALITRRSRRPLEQVCAQLPDIVQKHKFGLLGTHDLKEKIQSKGLQFERECRVFEVCSPAQAKAVLDRAIEVSTALPCRIAVYQEAGDTVLATIKPTTLLGLFGAGEARGIAEEVERSMVAIMDDAAR